VLARAAVVIAARVKHRYGCGDHTLYVGEVDLMAVNDPAAPLLFYAGKYALLQAAPESEEGAPYPAFF
jgi:flavin reductase (DIM6/NTAB) family NADH-FMN oxidoreductase RutF